jgi:hypothetical protein
MAKELKTNNMPNFKKNPDGMKPSGFKMKNSALHKSAKYGSPVHANYGAESPVKKTYKEAYADADKTKYDTYEKFEKAAKAYNTKKYGTTEPTRDSKKAGQTKAELAKTHSAKTKTKTKTEPTGHKGGDVLTKNIKDTSQPGDKAVRPKVATVAEPTVKEAKAARKLAKQKVKATRKKYGRGSDEVETAKEKRKIAKKRVKTSKAKRKGTKLIEKRKKKEKSLA